MDCYIIFVPCSLSSLLFWFIAGDLTKFGRGDTSSPSPATTLAQAQQSQTQTHHTTQQPFLNPALPPGYSYTSLPYYTGVPGLPNTFQYGPAMFPVRLHHLVLEI